MSPLEIKVIAPIPEEWGLCVTCEAFIAQADLLKKPADRSHEVFPPEWMDDYRQLSNVIMELSARYGDQILIKVFDLRSLQGIILCFRHGIFRYPAFIINGHDKVIGLDRAQIDQVIENSGCVLPGTKS